MRANRKKQLWRPGDIFYVEQRDGKACLGQILDLMMPNVPSCAFYDIRVPTEEAPRRVKLPFEKLIASLSTTREQLDRGFWKVIAHQAPALSKQFWPNEPCRDLQWVGAKTFGAGIVERFLNAFYGLAPWNYYADPLYFDRMLFSPDKNPHKLIFKKQNL